MTNEIIEINKAIHNMFRSYRCARSLVEHKLIVEKAAGFENEFDKFKTEVEPILAKKCLSLHGKDKFMWVNDKFNLEHFCSGNLFLLEFEFVFLGVR